MAGLFGGLEAGGTKFVCAVGTGPDDIVAQERFPTTKPEETIGQAIAFFELYKENLTAVGIGSFGPVDLNKGSDRYGYITSTPKPHWGDVDLVGLVRRALNVPVGFDTDVNAAALGEQKWGAAQGLDNFIYLTIGTGIGGGGMVEGRLLHGLVHPEMGHISLPHDYEQDPFIGRCPYHKDCLEGMASGPAIEARWGKPGHQLPEAHPAWDLEAHYLAHALKTFITVLSPQRIILGGGVMAQKQLLPMIRQKVLDFLNGYVQSPVITEAIDSYIVAPGLDGRAGVLGSMVLGEVAAR
jgi:fructokinase